LCHADRVNKKFLWSASDVTRYNTQIKMPEPSNQGRLDRKSTKELVCHQLEFAVSY